MRPFVMKFASSGQKKSRQEGGGFPGLVNGIG